MNGMDKQAWIGGAVKGLGNLFWRGTKGVGRAAKRYWWVPVNMIFPAVASGARAGLADTDPSRWDGEAEAAHMRNMLDGSFAPGGRPFPLSDYTGAGAGALGGLALGKAFGTPWWGTGLFGAAGGVAGHFMQHGLPKAAAYRGRRDFLKTKESVMRYTPEKLSSLGFPKSAAWMRKRAAKFPLATIPFRPPAVIPDVLATRVGRGGLPAVIPDVLATRVGNGGLRKLLPYLIASGALAAGAGGIAHELGDDKPDASVKDYFGAGAGGLGGLALGGALDLPWWATGLLGGAGGAAGHLLQHGLPKTASLMQKFAVGAKDRARDRQERKSPGRTQYDMDDYITAAPRSRAGGRKGVDRVNLKAKPVSELSKSVKRKPPGGGRAPRDPMPVVKWRSNLPAGKAGPARGGAVLAGPARGGAGKAGPARGGKGGRWRKLLPYLAAAIPDLALGAGLVYGLSGDKSEHPAPAHMWGPMLKNYAGAGVGALGGLTVGGALDLPWYGTGLTTGAGGVLGHLAQHGLPKV
jgi:hypothetical protein